MSEEPMGAKKVGYSFPMTWESMLPAYFIDPFKKRTVKSKTLITPTQAQIDAYDEWEKRYYAVLAEGESNGWCYSGYEGVEVTRPEPHYEYEYEEDQ